MVVDLERGQRVRLPGEADFVVLDNAPTPAGAAGGWRFYVTSDESGAGLRPVTLTEQQAGQVEVLAEDGGADSAEVLAGLWTAWMRQAASSSKATALASAPLVPYPHQNQAVYGAMLPQPVLRFLLADEPGTGKTIMGGLWLREAQRLGLAKRALIVAPAHLVSKWKADYERFLGGELRRITSKIVETDGEGVSALSVYLKAGHHNWIVSLELAAQNPAVSEAIHPDRAGWDAVIFDEAHRMTPTAATLHSVGRMLSENTPRVLLMTATPHRGDEWLFRSLMHLVDPKVFPAVDKPGRSQPVTRLQPGSLHFLRRMKEELVDYDGAAKLFGDREAVNIKVPLNAVERAYYNEALAMVEQYFAAGARELAKMVYGKRAASSLHALAQTLRRRLDQMGSATPVEAARAADPDDDDEAGADEARVIVETSQASREERKAIKEMLGRLDRDAADPELAVSKWPRLLDDCLAPNGIVPGGDRQLVVFTEFADTADWLVRRFEASGFTAQRYWGRDSHPVRDEIRAGFAAGRFQVLVSTDAGNEGIDLQTAQVLINWDIPWSLVRLEQRMGRIHRVGQTGKVWLYNLVATDTREGDALSKLLDRLVEAANELGGKMFDSLSLVGNQVLDQCGVAPAGAGRGADRLARLLRQTYEPGGDRRADEAVRLLTVERLRQTHEMQRRQADDLASQVDIGAAVTAWHDEQLERINPHVVEQFLRRAAAAKMISFERAPVHPGFFYLSIFFDINQGGGGRFGALSEALRPDPATGSSLVATSGEAKRAAVASGHAAAAAAVALGPGEPPFRQLVDRLGECLEPALYRGGRLCDPTAATGFELHAYEVTVVQGAGRREARSYLVRVDDTGPRPVAWETLANLEVANGAAGRPSPAAVAEAEEAARRAVADDIDARRAELSKWLGSIRRQLGRLPNDLTDHIAKPAERVAARERIEQATEARIDELQAMASVEAGPLRRVGWARVEPGAADLDLEPPDSERIAVKHVVGLLKADGWRVADVHTEGRGYDLHARKGSRQRCVEVKGLAGRASSRGISLTGNELLMAGQHGADYWLYVVDRCDEGGELYAAYQDPASIFADRVRDAGVLRIKGSDLEAARRNPRNEAA